VDGENRCFIRPNLHGENEIMKTTKLVMLVMTIAVALFMLIPNLS
jgi:hypothetical protein